MNLCAHHSSLAACDLVNKRPGHTEHGAYLRQRMSGRAKLEKFRDVAVFEFGRWVLFTLSDAATGSVLKRAVLASCYPLQVASRVVCAASVNVIDGRAFKVAGDKGHSDKPVNQARNPDAVQFVPDAKVSVLQQLLRKLFLRKKLSEVSFRPSFGVSLRDLKGSLYAANPAARSHFKKRIGWDFAPFHAWLPSVLFGAVQDNTRTSK